MCLSSTITIPSLTYYTRIKQQLNERKLSKTAMNKFDDLIHQEKEKQKTLGKKPFYFKNSLKKDLLNEERYLILSHTYLFLT